MWANSEFWLILNVKKPSNDMDAVIIEGGRRDLLGASPSLSGSDVTLIISPCSNIQKKCNFHPDANVHGEGRAQRSDTLTRSTAAD